MLFGAYAQENSEAIHSIKLVCALCYMRHTRDPYAHAVHRPPGLVRSMGYLLRLQARKRPRETNPPRPHGLQGMSLDTRFSPN
jgi:hypothetical protein